MLVRMEIDQAKQALLTGFFETYLPLSEEEEAKLVKEVKQMEKKEGEKIMEVMVSYERRGMEKGMEKGIIKGKREIARNMLKKGLEESLVEEVTGLTSEEITELKSES